MPLDVKLCKVVNRVQVACNKGFQGFFNGQHVHLMDNSFKVMPRGDWDKTNDLYMLKVSKETFLVLVVPILRT